MKLDYFLLCLICIFAARSVGAQDAPDTNKEKRFYRVYKNLNEQPTANEAWSGAITGKAQTYTVQTGDNLWSLSETLFGDSKFWPKIWSLNNEQIENPHEIKPLQIVQFMPGTMGEAPALAVTDGKPAVEAPKEVEPVKANDVKLPAAEHVSKVTKAVALPGSLPNWNFRKDQHQEVVMDLQKINRDFGSPNEILGYYLSDHDTQAVGTVTETEMGLSSASDFQYIYVKLSPGATDKKFVVLKELGELKDSMTGSSGSVVQIQGEIEVLESVNGDSSIHRAMVKRVINPIQVGAKLVAGDLPVYSARDEGSGQASARIIGGQHAIDRKIFGASNVVFLVGQGMTLGQSYPIYKIQGHRVSGTQALQNPRQIGRVKVVKLDQAFATGLILQSSDDIEVGDVTNPGAPEKSE